MNNTERQPNLTLRRFLFYEDCTIGELTDDQGEQICLTLEPPYRTPAERRIVGKTALAEGTYPLKLEYDLSLHYKNWHVGGTKSIRLCFLSKSGAEPAQTKGNILLGSTLNKEEGRLEDCVTAFETLMHYYEQKRINHGELRMRVYCDGFKGREGVFHTAPQSPDTELKDYELETW